MISTPPVLGLFQNEAELCEHVAANLSQLEQGLVLSSVEYSLANATGAGGRIDILAADTFGHVVVIELKRSDQSARSAIHELAKYISLLLRDAQIPRTAIRCIVLSTKWAELLLSLSYFAATAGVHVEGYLIVRDGDTVGYKPVELTPLLNLPQFSPEFSIFHYTSRQNREAHISDMRGRLPFAQFLKVAMILLDAPETAAGAPFLATACMWRISPEDHDAIEAAMGESIGHLEPYAYPEWEAECDALFWVTSDKARNTLFESAESERGTPEKFTNLLRRYQLAEVIRLGNWPQTDLVNTDQRIVGQLAGLAGSNSVARRNRHEFIDNAAPRFKSEWAGKTADFLEFIAFEQLWQSLARDFLDRVPADASNVIFQAFDSRHFFYTLHQATVHTEVQMSHFVISVELSDGSWSGLSGCYMWDGRKPPFAAEEAIKRVYGTLGWAMMAIFSGIDENRYEAALSDHGFLPVAYALSVDQDGTQKVNSLHGPGNGGKTLGEFVLANPSFMTEVSAFFGDIPKEPGGPGVVIALNKD